MNPLDEQVRTVIAMIRAVGGDAGIAPDAPDYIKREFLRMVTECPECREQLMGGHLGTAN